jgi:hypothetical protein
MAIAVIRNMKQIELIPPPPQESGVIQKSVQQSIRVEQPPLIASNAEAAKPADKLWPNLKNTEPFLMSEAQLPHQHVPYQIHARPALFKKVANQANPDLLHLLPEPHLSGDYKSARLDC